MRKINQILYIIFIIFLFNLIIPINRAFAEEIVNAFPSNGNLQTDTIYQLTEDTVLTTNLTIESDEVVTIDLNGYVLCGIGNGSIITNKGSLTLKDSQPTRKVSYFEKNETAEWKWIKDATDDNNGEYIAISGGILTGGYDKTANSAGSGGGGAIKMSSNNLNNVLNFEGGTVVGNKTKRAGGAFYGGKINMSGGLIIGNYAEGFSAAVSISGNLNMTGGEISDQNVTDSLNSAYDNNANVVVGTNSNVYMSGGILKGVLTTRNGGSSKNTFSMSGGDLIGKIEIRNQMETKISGGNVVGNIIMTSGKCTVSDSAVLQNGGEENGSCVYITDGIFTMTGGKIKDSNTEEFGGAVKVANGTAKITGGIVQNCSASNGGAVYVSGGDFELSGTGVIEYCSATSGGGVFVQDGNVSVLGGNISNCSAINGGGIYISNGNITMDGGTISNNKAEENGGGIYASSETQNINVLVSSGSIVGNIANLNGGAIGVNMGNNLTAIVNIGLETCNGIDETHSHPVIQNNTSNENGGGLWLNGDQLTMNMYCGSVEKNLAILEPGSANIYQTGGLATVYAGTVGEGIIVIGGEYVSNSEDAANEEVKITYDLNIYGTEQILDSYVTTGVEIYLPKNIFTRENYVLIGWSYVEEPTENDTIYEVGGAYTVPNNDVTVYAIWLRIGAGDVIQPIITSGRKFDQITGGTNLMLTSNSSFTIQMTVNNVEPNIYRDRTLTFNRNLIPGTCITMVDLTNSQDRIIYNYKVTESNITQIPLTNFVKNGGSDIYYENSTSTELLNEIFLFIVDLPKDNEIEEANQITLTRYSKDADVAPIEQILSYTTAEDKKIDISIGLTNDILNVSYIKNNSTTANSRYLDKEMSLVITEESEEKLPSDLKIQIGQNYYEMNDNRQIIIPIGNANESFNKNIKLHSNALNKSGFKVDLSIELWVSDSKDATKPFMGECVDVISGIQFNTENVPSINIDMPDKIYSSQNFSGDLTIISNSINISNCDISVELQKKSSQNNYQTINAITKVNSTNSSTGNVFYIKLRDNEDINLNFVEGFNESDGTYRVLIKIYNNDEIISQLPYNFIIKN